MDRTTARFALVLGVLSALGPVAVDMYLPALPLIAQDLRAAQGPTEATLMAFFVGLTAGQLVYGPVADRVGRRPPLLVGVALFIGASVACSLSPDLTTLIVARFFQGLGAGAGMVVGSAVIRDLYTGHEAARLQALRVLVLGVSPILAPILGAGLIAVAPWRSVFWVSAAFGVAGMAMLLAFLPETRPAEARRDSRLWAAFAAYGALLRDRAFLGIVLSSGLVQAAFYAYLAGSAFVFIDLNKTPPWLYSVIFGVNAAGFIGGAQFVPQLMRRYGAEPVVLMGMMVMAVATGLLLIAALMGQSGLGVVVPLLFLALSCIGFVGGPAMVLALKDHGASGGAASALMGFIQAGLGAVTTALVALFANGTAIPMMGVMAGFSITGLALARFAFKRPPA